VGVEQACTQISRLLIASAEPLAAIRTDLGGGTGKGRNRLPGRIHTVTPECPARQERKPMSLGAANVAALIVLGAAWLVVTVSLMVGTDEMTMVLGVAGGACVVASIVVRVRSRHHQP
jgi:hypothetical protein